MTNPVNKDLYYTKDHEWIDFQDLFAYVGVSSFKLIGFKEIQQITFHAVSGFIKRGEKIASIKYNDYQIEVHMPVDGTILKLNNIVRFGNKNILKKYAETKGWIAFIEPLIPDDRNHLVKIKKYQINAENKSGKQQKE
jgi:glycine cleavage system H protein